MRLLTHNSLRNNSKEADGRGFPLKITAVDVQVVDTVDATNIGDKELQFVRSIMPSLDWNALLQGAKALGIPSLPPVLTPEMAADENFQKALFHVLMNVRLEKGMLTCPVTGREFPVTNGIANMMLEEAECERVKL